MCRNMEHQPPLQGRKYWYHTNDLKFITVYCRQYKAGSLYDLLFVDSHINFLK